MVTLTNKPHKHDAPPPPPPHTHTHYNDASKALFRLTLGQKSNYVISILK